MLLKCNARYNINDRSSAKRRIRKIIIFHASKYFLFRYRMMKGSETGVSPWGPS